MNYKPVNLPAIAESWWLLKIIHFPKFPTCKWSLFLHWANGLVIVGISRTHAQGWSKYLSLIYKTCVVQNLCAYFTLKSFEYWSVQTQQANCWKYCIDLINQTEALLNWLYYYTVDKRLETIIPGSLGAAFSNNLLTLLVNSKLQNLITELCQTVRTIYIYWIAWNGLLSFGIDLDRHFYIALPQHYIECLNLWLDMWSRRTMADAIGNLFGGAHNW